MCVCVCVCMHTTHICEDPTDSTFNASTNSMMSKTHGRSALWLISTSGHSHNKILASHIQSTWSSSVRSTEPHVPFAQGPPCCNDPL